MGAPWQAIQLVAAPPPEGGVGVRARHVPIGTAPLLPATKRGQQWIQIRGSRQNGLWKTILGFAWCIRGIPCKSLSKRLGLTARDSRKTWWTRFERTAQTVK